MEKTKFEKYIRDKFEPEGEMDCFDEDNLILLLNGPLHYGNEDEMLTYAESRPDATMEELIEYWDSITPDGLAPGDDGEDLLEDE